MTLRCLRDLSGVAAERWDALDHGTSPFLEHGFLTALELSGSVGPGSGWSPRYLLAEERGELVGAVAAYVKTDSFGEYIFDWSWAHACERAGFAYYPKLVIAAPFTPATGQRILLAPGADRERMTAFLADAVRDLAREEECSSIHWLFTTREESERLGRHGFSQRASYQFHWRNRGYREFDDFLAALTSRKRKQFRKERRRAVAAVDRIEFLSGRELGPRELAELDRFYRTTVRMHGQFDYLQPGFFEELVRLSPDRVLFARAARGESAVGGALFLESERALYGRYWGSTEEVDCLHFEVAYYAGIARCIERGLELFEAGAQGEHKLLRGFEPSRTYSAHSFFHPELSRAIDFFLAEEARSVDQRMARLAEFGPYRAESDGNRQS